MTQGDGPAVFRCSLRNGRVAVMASVTTLLAASWLAMGLAGMPGMRLLPWLGIAGLIVLPTAVFLGFNKIVIDGDQVRVHAPIVLPSVVRRAAVAEVRPPRSGLGFFADADGKVLASFRDLYSTAQLSEIASLLAADHA